MIEAASVRNLALLGVAAIGSALLGAAIAQGNRASIAADGLGAHNHMMGAGAGRRGGGAPRHHGQAAVLRKTAERSGAFDRHGARRVSAECLYAETSASRLGHGLRAQGQAAPAARGRTGRHVRQGTTWFEPPGTVHLFAESASATEPAEAVGDLRRGRRLRAADHLRPMSFSGLRGD
ncbi:hypothetical protein [Mesorhizobium silamurunense]|uniref:hypothetical protein n=1 Tax=Mesorhizobium silamurunense TaxID=499528 RepID=UPI001FE479A8|nr:hypothetical protein [Mesorhizobium silamurunense]